MNTIKNLHKISGLMSPDKLVELENAANLHLRHSNIDFKIIGIDGYDITVRTTQGKHISENYADSKTLITRTRELFERYLPGYTIFTHPLPYVPSAVEVVDSKWINDAMLNYGIKVKDIQFHTGIDKTNLSAWINGVRPMSQPVKAMFFNFFKSHAINQFVDFLMDNSSYGPFSIRDYIGKDLIENLVKMSGKTLDVDYKNGFVRISHKH